MTTRKLIRYKHREELLIMGWIEGIGEAVSYIEDNITEELTIEDIATQAYYCRQ